jgi:hypothetical protein
MSIGFDNIIDHIIPMDNFSLKWRFTDPEYNKLPYLHLCQLKPLDKTASNFLWNFISKTNLHADIPFKKDFFSVIDKIEAKDDNKSEIKKWLYQRGLSFDKEVYLSWQPDTAMIVPWKLLIKYFDDFCYADDLTIIDQSLNWALLFFHEGDIYFGTNKVFLPSKLYEDLDFIW